MSYFVIEINVANEMRQNDGCDLSVIATIIEYAGGRLIDANLDGDAQLLSLLVEAKSERIVADLLEAYAFGIGQIRHVFVLATAVAEDSQDFTGPLSRAFSAEWSPAVP